MWGNRSGACCRAAGSLVPIRSIRTKWAVAQMRLRILALGLVAVPGARGLEGFWWDRHLACHSSIAETLAVRTLFVQLPNAQEGPTSCRGATRTCNVRATQSRLVGFRSAVTIQSPVLSQNHPARHSLPEDPTITGSAHHFSIPTPRLPGGGANFPETLRQGCNSPGENCWPTRRHWPRSA